jgi:hypothetical protein
MNAQPHYVLFDPRAQQSAMAEFAYTSMIPIHVYYGENLTIFHVHEAMLVNRSGFFKGALRSGSTFISAEDRKGTLDNTSPRVFSRWLHTAYTNTIGFNDGPALGSNTRDYDRMIRLYMFADYLLDPRTKNIMIRGILAKCREQPTAYVPTAGEVALLYRNTQPGDLMRKLLVDITTQIAAQSYFNQPLERYHEEYIVDASYALAALRFRTTPLPREEDVERCSGVMYLCPEDVYDSAPVVPALAPPVVAAQAPLPQPAADASGADAPSTDAPNTDAADADAADAEAPNAGT